jgi:hypothetical protein
MADRTFASPSVKIQGGGLGEAQLLCPYCGENYVHPRLRAAYGDEAYTLDSGPSHRDYTSPLGNRGDWLAIPVCGESCGHIWRFVIGFHKGEVFLGAVPA